ncbi:ATP-binding protein [Anaerotignum sp.]|nr:ATP-binding protein [Anaerotignum sp.]MBQ7758112.1 ATP-binding protein [Anaerotignum sp.]
MATRTQIYKEVLREYDALRTQKMAELRERKESLYMRFPRLEEIEQELSLLGVSTAKLVLLSPDALEGAVAQMKQKQQDLEDERMGIMAKNCLSPSLLKIEYVCENCKDTGYVENEPCACMKHKLMDRLYDQSNVRDVVKMENFDTFDLRLFNDEVVPAEGISPKENAKRNLKMTMAFAEDFTGDNLLLYGGAGRGKTFLCNCIAKDVLDRGKTVLYLTAGQLFKQLEEMRFRNKEEEEDMDWDAELLDADLLIIDDLGTEFATMFTASELFRIINDRKLRKRPVVISTNLDYKALMDQYSDRVMSRLIGEYTTLKFFGEDIRMKKKYNR